MHDYKLLAQILCLVSNKVSSTIEEIRFELSRTDSDGENYWIFVHCELLREYGMLKRLDGRRADIGLNYNSNSDCWIVNNVPITTTGLAAAMIYSMRDRKNVMDMKKRLEENGDQLAIDALVNIAPLFIKEEVKLFATDADYLTEIGNKAKFSLEDRNMTTSSGDYVEHLYGFVYRVKARFTHNNLREFIYDPATRKINYSTSTQEVEINKSDIEQLITALALKLSHEENEG